MQKYGLPEKVVRIVKLLYYGLQCAVEDQGGRGDWFDIKTGVRLQHVWVPFPDGY